MQRDEQLLRGSKTHRMETEKSVTAAAARAGWWKMCFLQSTAEGTGIAGAAPLGRFFIEFELYLLGNAPLVFKL